ncbi:MAG: hypothetical protein JO360_08085 [Acidobacteria bacterium]|nr:hypothetical protein [Acidobacteriota bacterium]
MHRLFGIIAIITLSTLAANAQVRVKNENAPTERTDAPRALVANRNLRRNDPRVLTVGPSSTYLKEGLPVDEVVRVLGEPLSVNERQEGETRTAVYFFQRSEGRVLVAEFEKGLLVRSNIRTEAELAGQIAACPQL